MLVFQINGDPEVIVMFKKKSIIFVFMFAVQMLTPTVSIASQDAVAQSAKPSVLWGIGCDLLNLGQGLLSGIYSLGSYAYGAWNEYATPNRVYGAAGIIGAVYLYNYYAVISAIKKQYDEKKSGKLCVWGKDRWKNHAKMRVEILTVLSQLDSERTECAIKLPRNDAQRALNLKATINTELASLEVDMKSLENQFLIFFKIVEYLPFGLKALGLERNYKQIKAARGASNIEEINWSEDQFNRINSDMENAAAISWWHPLYCTLNYGYAASVWWELKQAWMRLKVLEPEIALIAAENAVFPKVTNNPVNVSQNKVAIKHSVGPL